MPCKRKKRKRKRKSQMKQASKMVYDYTKLMAEVGVGLSVANTLKAAIPKK